RIKALKEIISGLHHGTPQDQVRQQLKEMVRQTDASEIAAMEQSLIADGMPVAELMAMCDLHSQVVSEILVQRPTDPVLPGHPVDTFRRENQALLAATRALREDLALLLAGRDEETADLGKLHLRFNALMDVDKHYARKENLLFPVLERHGISGPSKVMWGKDDEVREFLRGVGEMLGAEASVGEWRVAAQAVVEPALQAAEEMVRKEEEILLPMALEALSAAEWGEIWAQTPQFGYCLVEPGDEYRPPAPALLQIEGAPLDTRAPFLTPTGALTIEQLKGIFAALPLDLTFVDAEDRVRYFSESASRVFARPRTILGRKVQHCHPPSSVGVVEQILADFRAGRQDACSFWIDFKGRFVQIRYFAVRSENGQYLGTLEVTQDLSEARSLQGERRLLEYDPHPA
ncbi:MAG: DUF438 domain-containing protein, partial [Candidatus Latescibacteria bacterium]|nr:DUF438 domain-containing protein [Candidatus Latescibacterota bacterium]